MQVIEIRENKTAYKGETIGSWLQKHSTYHKYSNLLGHSHVCNHDIGKIEYYLFSDTGCI